VRENPTPEPGDRDRRPFSNGSEGETWTYNVCGGGRDGLGCIHDSAYGQADEELGAEVHCPLITLSMLGVWPHEWPAERVTWTDQQGVEHYYERPGMCSEYADELPAATDPPVIAVDLFGVYAAEPADTPVHSWG